MRSRSVVRQSTLLLAIFSLAGCSALAPQITPQRLIHRAGDTANKTPKTFDEAYDAAAELQGLYATAVMDQGNATPQLSAALLGLSALTLFKGITGANTRDVAAAGVLGSVGWAAHSSFISQPRLEVYRAGVDALQCAMAAVAPFRPGQNRLGLPEDAAGSPTLYGRHKAADAQRDALRALLGRLAPLKEGEVVETQPFRAARPVVEYVKPSCRNPGAQASAIEQLNFLNCQRQPARAVKKDLPQQDSQSVTRMPPLALAAAFVEADAEMAYANARILHAETVMGAIENAGPALWTKTVAIHNNVSREVQQTTPNIASVLAAAKGMKEVSFGGMALPVPTSAKPSVFDAQSAKELRRATAADTQATAELRQAVRDLQGKVLELDQLSRRALGSGYEQARADLNRCAVKATGVTLTISPAGDTRDLPLGSPGVFFVSGGSGVPLASVVSGPRAANITFQPEGGLFRFVFTPPSGAVAGEEYTLRFIDGGSSGVEQRVIVKLTPTVAGTNPGTAAGTDNTRKVFATLSEADLKQLELDKTATDDAVRAKLKACKDSAPKQHVLKDQTGDGDLIVSVLKALRETPQKCTL